VQQVVIYSTAHTHLHMNKMTVMSNKTNLFLERQTDIKYHSTQQLDGFGKLYHIPATTLCASNKHCFVSESAAFVC